MARLHTGRRKVLSRYRSYHGNTTTAINLTGDPRRWPNDAGAEEQECERALRHLRRTIELESIPGTAGIMVAPAGHLAGVRELRDRHGIVWIADEVMSGFGRAGRWFACELAGDGVRPDLIAFAKGELVRDRSTREPLVPCNAAGEANAPMARLAAACRQRGLLPFVNGSRTHVVPPLVITDDEAHYGLALLTEALDDVAATL